MSNFSKHKKELLILSKASPSLAQKILAKSPNSLLKALCEIALNILNGVIKLSPAKKQRLSKFKSQLRGLANKGTSQSKREHLQTGGFLASLLSIGLPLAYNGIRALVTAIKRKKATKRGRKSRK